MLELSDEKLRVSNYGTRYQTCKTAVSRAKDLKSQIEKDLETKIKAVH